VVELFLTAAVIDEYESFAKLSDAALEMIVDLAGALKAGCRAAFVARPGKSLNPKGAKPDISGADLREVAEQIIGKDA
jgi:hypothetical protein